MKRSNYDISEGRSNIYLPHAIFTLFIALPLLYFLPLVGVILFILFIFLIRTKSGMEIDVQNRKYRGYKEILNYRFGVWDSFDGYNHIILKQHIDKERRGSIYSDDGYSTDTYVSYDLILSNGKDEKFAYEFMIYSLARKTMNVFTEHAYFTGQDDIDKAKAKLRKRFNEKGY